MMFDDKDLKRAKIDIKAELNRLEAQQTAKEVAGKSIGQYGLFYITLIVIIGVAASLELDEGKMAAVMGLLGASLTALISMLNNIAGATPKQDKPEFEVMKQLIDRLDRMADRDPMSVTVEGDKVTVKKGDNKVESVR
jgi:ABC-type proline/glycine betaine transport system ATPase subunit